MVKKPKICTHEGRKEEYKCGSIPVYKCYSCNLVFTPQRKQNSNTKKLYKNFYRNEIPTRFRFSLEYVIKLFRFFRAFKLHTVYKSAKSILDIGSGRGLTLYYLKKYHNFKKTVGTQINKRAVTHSRKVLGLKIYDEDLLKINFGRQKFDIVSMWHVLEHVNEPESYVKKIYSLLEKNGKVIIEVPNYNSWTRSFTGEYWLGMDIDYHLSFFTPKTLTALLKKYKFKAISTRTFSLEYSTFISAQSIISKITKTDQVFFKWLQTKICNRSITIHILLFIPITPICFIINLIYYYSKRGEVLLIIAEK
ncbi:class I SAM-dependent methyltransferase [Patescibacteria group bacterium]